MGSVKSSWKPMMDVHIGSVWRAILIALAIFAVLILHTVLRPDRRPSSVVNGPRWYQPVFLRKLLFLLLPLDTIPKARLQHGDQPFTLLNYTGELTVFSAKYADIIGSDKRLTLGEFLRKEFHTHGPGLSPIANLHDEQRLVQRVTKRFSKSLARDQLRRALVLEAVANADRVLGQTEAWQEIGVYDLILDAIARLDIRAMWGDTLAHNEEWVNLAKTYMVAAVAASIELHIAPVWLRPLVQLLSPHCRETRRLVDQANRIIMPIVHERRALKAKAAANGIPPPNFDDAIEWAENESTRPDYDIHGVQLAILIGAVHISADTCTQVMIMLAQRPDTVDELRTEIKKCLGDHGLAKSTFHNMKLLDSVIKETLRFKPASMFSMERGATCDIEVAPGIMVHRNERLVVDMSNQRDPELYPKPDVFQPDRFLKLRDHPGWGSKALLSSTSPEHLAFGHGLQACPGRFFAEIKIKILLCHLLLTYDWKLAPETKTNPSMFGPMLVANQKTRVLYKKRENSFDMSTL